MTYPELLKNIANGEMNDEIMSTAADLLEKHIASNAKKNAAAALKRAEANAEKAPLREALFNVIGAEPMTATQLIEAAGLVDTVKPASVPSLLKSFVAEGSIVKTDIKVTGKGTVRGYVRG